MNDGLSRCGIATHGACRLASGPFLAFALALTASLPTSAGTLVILVTATRLLPLLVVPLTECTFDLVLR